MKGFNSFTFNQDQMKEAVEYYLNKVLLRQQVSVYQVTEDKQSNSFIIKTEEKQPEPDNGTEDQTTYDTGAGF